MRIIPLIRVRGKRISVDFEEIAEKGYTEIYVIDEGEDLNLNLYEEIGGIFKLWVEPCNTFLDVVDVLISGASYAVITEKMPSSHLKESMKATDKIAFKYEGNMEKLRIFLEMGGNIVVFNNPNHISEIKVDKKILISENIMDAEIDVYRVVVPYEVIGGD